MKKFNLTHPNLPLSLREGIKGFTLVELIIVITILAILSTIAFISFKDYFADARDANRTVTLGNIRQSLDLQKMKTRKYPTPSEAVSYTGGNSEIKQGVITKEILSDMTTDPKDPSSGDYYTYSVSKDGRYYQLLSQLENEVSYKNIITPTYADDYESVKVEGNYKFDPSLPSLVIVPSSYTSGSGIFDPSVCFVLDGGENTLTTCSKKKSEMSLKDFDKSLVGYWDMETIFNGGGIDYVKDISGNNHDLLFTGNLSISSLTGGIISNGLTFDGTGFLYSIENTGSNLEINNTTTNGADFTLTAFIKPTFSDYDQYPLSDIISKSQNYSLHFRYGRGIGGYSTNVIFTGSLGIKCGWSSDITTDCSLYGTGIAPNKYFMGTWYENILPKQQLNTKYYLVAVKQLNTIKYYLDGKLILSQNSYDIKLAQSTIFMIGGHQLKYGNLYGGDQFSTSSKTGFKGIIDDVKIYNRALSDQEIAQQAKMVGLYGN